MSSDFWDESRPWHECPYRIWLDVEADIFVVVSREDYDWANKWKWQITWDRHKRKVYATRSPGRLTDGSRSPKLYLHKEILKRKDILPPTSRHTMGDHGDGQSRNCQRYNLSWATPSMNRRTARPPVATTRVIEEAPF
jgi:hypothetical protein